MRLEDVLSAWQKFWFRSQSPLTISVFRIVFGLIYLSHASLLYWSDFSTFFGPNPLITNGDYVAYWWKKDLGPNIFEFVPADTYWHAGILILNIIFALMLTLGLFTRASTFAAYICCSSMQRQYPFLCNAGDNMQRIVLFLLLFSSAGQGLSLDAVIKGGIKNWKETLLNPPLSAPWAQRMLQLQVALAYFSTGLLKFNSGYWFYGNGVYLATRLIDFAKFPLPEVLDHRLPLYALNWLTIFIELALGTLIWFKRCRYWVILSGVLMHIGIDFLLNIPIFEFVFMSMYILFVDPADLQKLGKWFLLFFKQLRAQMNKKDVMRICLMIIIFIWITIATMPYRLGIVQSKAGHFYDENMSSQEFLVLKQKEKLSKMKDVPLEAKWDCDEALGKIMWASFRPAVAADIFADTKRQREKAYKTYDKKLINTMVMLAAAYRDVNRMEESDALYEEVWKLDKENLLPGDSNLTRDQTNLAMINYLRGDSEEKLDLQKKYFKLCLEHIQRAQELWHQAKDPDIAKLVHLFFLKYLACRELGDEANSKQAYGEMKYLDKRVKHICYPPRT